MIHIEIKTIWKRQNIRQKRIQKQTPNKLKFKTQIEMSAPKTQAQVQND